VFLGCSVFFAIHDAVKAARQERGISGPWKLNSPLTPEKIRMACEDKFTKMVCYTQEKKKNLHFCPLGFMAKFLLKKKKKHDCCFSMENDRNSVGHVSGIERLVNVALFSSAWPCLVSHVLGSLSLEWTEDSVSQSNVSPCFSPFQGYLNQARRSGAVA
jgi:hypothetical protein